MKKTVCKYFLGLSMTLVMIISMLPISLAQVHAVDYSSSIVISVAEGKFGSTAYSGKCLAFVRACHLEAYGYASTACCAYKYGTNYLDSTDTSNIPVGADVFFSGSKVICSCGNHAGHVGIYAGDGYIIHAWAGKVQKTTISRVTSAGYTIRGWGWHNHQELTNAPAPTYQIGYYQVSTSGSKLNLRSGPGTSYGIFFSIPDTTTIYITEINGAWGKTSYNDQVGWVSMTYVTKIVAPPTPTPPPTPSPTPTPPPTPSPTPTPPPTPSPTPTAPTVSYQTHVQDVGWQAYVANGQASGTSGQSKRLEAIHIKLDGVAGGIEYRTHVQDIGWQDFVANDALSGTSGQAKRLEAIQIRLTGDAATKYDVYYRVHAQNVGWMDWAKNGASAGTAGFSYRLEAIKIVLVPKGNSAPGATTRSFIQKTDPNVTPTPVPNAPAVLYKTHVQDIGWQDYVRNGAQSGTSAQSKRLEGIQIKLANIPGGIEYSTHIQDIGWQGFVADDAMSGTSGQSKRLEAIKIRLTGAAADAFDVYYCVHAQNTGWLDWAKNGESAGTAGFGYRLEAIKVVLVPKGGPAPGATARAFVQG